ncbi:MAG: hypothetical protein R3328_12905, partial [Planococcaceae bacterium]|nr:hypothetical protein [Planococcaceae bacterium]
MNGGIAEGYYTIENHIKLYENKKYYLFLMKYKLLMKITAIIFVSLLVACSPSFDEFNDEKIMFNVVDTISTSEYTSYTIEIKNETGFELTHLIFTMSYPIKISNGNKENPFVIEGKTVNTVKPVTLKSGESIQFSISAPIKEVFSDNDLLDFENPDV